MNRRMMTTAPSVKADEAEYAEMIWRVPVEDGYSAEVTDHGTTLVIRRRFQPGEARIAMDMTIVEHVQ